MVSHLVEAVYHMALPVTPYGRYHFHQLPFGICSASEHLQKQMSRILQGLPGVLCQMDDVLVYGKDKDEHDVRLEAVLLRIQEAGVTLNIENCKFGKLELLFIGHRINQHGVQADPAKTSAIQNMCSPTNVSEL